MKLIKLLILFCLTSSVWAYECNPSARGDAKLVDFRVNGILTVTGKLAGFDPCNNSVSLKVPSGSTKPPLLIYLHGGGGLSPYEKSALSNFRDNGIATLEFDAYQMNGFTQDWRFWGHKVSNGGRQQLLFSSAVGAYKWALTLTEIDTNRIYFYGLSNGAAVAVNMAAVVNKDNVKGIFAEGTPGMGLGLPDKVNVPVKLIYGKMDNYGSREEDIRMWQRTTACWLNEVTPDIPAGNANTCNTQTESPQDWASRQKSKVEMWFYEDAAHGMFIGNYIDKKSATLPSGMFVYMWTGAEQSARKKLVADITTAIKN